jgi:hypothetical protein
MDEGGGVGGEVFGAVGEHGVFVEVGFEAAGVFVSS